ncbi:hypothetical protein BKA70DRAFT_1230947 [Coprinopsis sp. MPI-PUGE-AT-0042]|nr:hypothetical protein BKA70DRAFT_1230947 [Coprinopsis sp. MPI-PUGE-AT-0042]
MLLAHDLAFLVLQWWALLRGILLSPTCCEQRGKNERRGMHYDTFSLTWYHQFCYLTPRWPIATRLAGRDGIREFVGSDVATEVERKQALSCHEVLASSIPVVLIVNVRSVDRYTSLFYSIEVLFHPFNQRVTVGPATAHSPALPDITTHIDPYDESAFWNSR